ncbi:MAG: PAS domain S-box protein [Gemmatimonadaceae bacterium]
MAEPSGLMLEQAFAFFFEHSGHAYYIFDPDSLRFLAVNEAAVRRYGYSREEFRDMTLRDIRPPEDFPAFFAANYQPGLGVKHVGRFRHRARDGRTIPVEITAYDLVFEGRYVRLVEALDMSDGVQAGHELRQWEDRFRAVAESLSEALILMDLKGIIQYANPMASHFFGMPREEVIGRDVRQFVRPERLAQAERNLQDRMRGIGAVTEDAIVRPDGSLLWVEVHATPFRGPDGTITGTVSTFVDITGRRRAQQDLEHSLSLLKATLESTADGILVVDRTGVVANWNESFRLMWRIPRDMLDRRDGAQLLQHVAVQLKDPEGFLESAAHMVNVAASDESFDILDLQDGRVLERYSLPQRIGDQIVGRVWSFRDVTERRRAEAALQRTQKVEAIGLLAGGVAHDFNNVLTAILGCAELALLETCGNEKVMVELEEIRRTAISASALTRQLLLFSRKRERMAERLGFNDAVRSAERMLRRLIFEDLPLHFIYDQTVGDVVVDAGEMEQVLINLALNARDACERGGDITIATSHRRVAKPGSASDEPISYAALTVTDSGEGMDAETRQRVFEPFFTTKPPGKGTGLGMAAVLAIVERSAGMIEVESTKGVGTAVTVLLPELVRSAPAQVTPEEVVSVQLATEKILVVEDAPALRRSTRKMLEQQGYTVRDATNGVEALDLLAAEGAAAFALVLTDVVMPRMGGRELAGHILRRWPTLRVMLMTGYDDGGVADDVTRRLPLLEKPFAMKDLVRAVRRTLDAPVPGA